MGQGQPVGPGFRRRTEAVGPGRVLFHGLRKSAAVAYAMAGCSTKEIASITGQSDQMVAFYTKGANRMELARSAVTTMERKVPTGKANTANRAGKGLK